MNIHYILEESIFITIVFKPFSTEEILKYCVNDCFENVK